MDFSNVVLWAAQSFDEPSASCLVNVKLAPLCNRSFTLFCSGSKGSRMPLSSHQNDPNSFEPMRRDRRRTMSSSSSSSYRSFDPSLGGDHDQVDTPQDTPDPPRPISSEHSTTTTTSDNQAVQDQRRRASPAVTHQVSSFANLGYFHKRQFTLSGSRTLNFGFKF